MTSPQTHTVPGPGFRIQDDPANEDAPLADAHHSTADQKQPAPLLGPLRGHVRSRSSYTPTDYVPVSYSHRHKHRPPSLSLAHSQPPCQVSSPADPKDTTASPASISFVGSYGSSLFPPTPQLNHQPHDASSSATRHSRGPSETLSTTSLQSTTACFHSPVAVVSNHNSPFSTPMTTSFSKEDTILEQFAPRHETEDPIGDDDDHAHEQTHSKHMARSISEELIAGLSLGLPYTLAASLLQRPPEPVSKFGAYADTQLSHKNTLTVSGILVSITLLCMSITGQAKRILDPKTSTRWKTEPVTPNTLLSTLLSIGLPFYSSLSLGAGHVAIAYLLVHSSGSWGAFGTKPWRNALNFAKRRVMLLVFLCELACDISGITSSHPLAHTIKGYLALITSLFVLPPMFCFPIGASTSSTAAKIQEQSNNDTQDQVSKLSTLHPFNPKNSLVFFAASIGLGVFAIVSSILFGTRPVFSPTDVLVVLVAGGAATVAISFVSPSSLSPAAVNAVSLTGLSSSFFTATFLSPTPFSTFMSQGFFFAATYSAIFLDLEPSRGNCHEHSHHHHHDYTGHDLNSSDGQVSGFTKWLLHAFDTSPLLFSIVRDKDSRKIFYFMLLNFVFMIVQMTYGIVTGSLGLLSDSIHMLFDCLALAVGLSAAVMSKWPPSARFPYGYGKIDTLAGFANGVFLMIISVEIIYEAIERLTEGTHIQRLGELFFVSTAGLLVNLVGIMSFDHAHHGHGHGDGHHHHNENMHGIFLHILADTMGSVAVVVSTMLVHFYGWSGFDPIASCIIALLIFASAVPLVKTTATSLLLVLPADVEYRVRDALGELGNLGDVVAYAKPRFWMDDRTGDKEECRHDHGHDHHGYSHSHSHSQPDVHHHHSHTEDNDVDGQLSGSAVLGAVHIIASRNAPDLDQVRRRTSAFLQQRALNITVQVEREGDVRCWCGGGSQNI